MTVPLVLLVIVVLVFVVVLATPRGDVVIKVRSGSVEFRGRIPQGKEARIREFLTQIAQGRDFSVVYSYPRGDRRPPLKFRGSLTDGEKQQIRNYLLSELFAQ